jgi:hypothetical protein
MGIIVRLAFHLMLFVISHSPLVIGGGSIFAAAYSRQSRVSRKNSASSACCPVFANQAAVTVDAFPYAALLSLDGLSIARLHVDAP